MPFSTVQRWLGITIRRMDGLAAWVVLILGALLLVGGMVGAFNGVRDHDLDAPLRHLLVMLLVVIAMRRAATKLRSVDIG
jgi:hypothetical protein